MRPALVTICVVKYLKILHNEALMSPFFNLARKTTLNSELIHKYNQTAPRYTSYPTALKFRVVDDIESGKAMYMVGEDTGPFSLYFHLPFCKSLCWFCGCTKVISTDETLADKYINYLEKEIALVRPRIRSDRKVIQLHFGGGSPNFLTPRQIDRLSDLIHFNFNFEENAEMSVELDPRTLTEDKVKAFQRMGINRASIGVQDVNAKVQKAVHRIQPSAMNYETIQWLQDAGIKELNVDLIYGLPYQTPKTFAKTLDEAIAYDPDRFALFSYAHVPWSVPAQKILERSPSLHQMKKLRCSCSQWTNSRKPGIATSEWTILQNRMTHSHSLRRPRLYNVIFRDTACTTTPRSVVSEFLQSAKVAEIIARMSKISTATMRCLMRGTSLLNGDTY